MEHHLREAGAEKAIEGRVKELLVKRSNELPEVVHKPLDTATDSLRNIAKHPVGTIHKLVGHSTEPAEVDRGLFGQVFEVFLGEGHVGGKARGVIVDFFPRGLTECGFLGLETTTLRGSSLSATTFLLAVGKLADDLNIGALYGLKLVGGFDAFNIGDKTLAVLVAKGEHFAQLGGVKTVFLHSGAKVDWIVGELE